MNELLKETGELSDVHVLARLDAVLRNLLPPSLSPGADLFIREVFVEVDWRGRRLPSIGRQSGGHG